MLVIMNCDRNGNLEDYLFLTHEMNECERVIEMVKELSVSVNSFIESEISDIVSFICTMVVFQ